MTARCAEFGDGERRWAFARADITKGIRLPEAHHEDVASRRPIPFSELSECR